MTPLNRRLITSALLVITAALPAHAAFLNHHFSFASGLGDQVNPMVLGTAFGNAHVAGGVLLLDGNGDYVEFTTPLVPNAGTYSVALFAKGTGVQTGVTELISQGFSGGPGFYIGTDHTGVSMRVTDVWTATGVPFGAPNTWTHYALVVDSSLNQSTLYVNGVPAATLGMAIATNISGTPTRFGAQFAAIGEYFNGALDDVRIYDGLLTGGEVLALANPVPEPATAWSMGFGLLALLGLRRRRSA